MPDVVIVPRGCVGDPQAARRGRRVEPRPPASKIRFQPGNAVLTPKLIDGHLPDYSRVILTANDKP